MAFWYRWYSAPRNRLSGFRHTLHSGTGFWELPTLPTVPFSPASLPPPNQGLMWFNETCSIKDWPYLKLIRSKYVSSKFVSSSPSIVPPLKDENEARDERRRASQGHVELGREGRQEHGGHADAFSDFQRSSQIIDDKDNLQSWSKIIPCCRRTSSFQLTSRNQKAQR